MPLDQQVKRLLDQMRAAGELDLARLEPRAAREVFREQRLERGEPQAVNAVENLRIPGPATEIPLRVYTPAGRPPFPVLAFFHGGGFVLCDLDSHDGLCRALCNAAKCTVVSVDYRLAPEAKFPAAAEDCYQATRWVAENAGAIGGDASRIGVAGDSAGGNLAAVTALQARSLGPELRFQLLIYPVIDCRFDTKSYLDNAEGYFLTRDMMRWFWGHYLSRDDQADDPLASPLRAPDLAGLPSAHVITAEYDPLRDEGEAYAQRLRAAGVEVELVRYDGMIHGFVSMFELLDQGKAALTRACDALAKAL